jgi:hypothetical protein
MPLFLTRRSNLMKTFKTSENVTERTLMRSINLILRSNLRARRVSNMLLRSEPSNTISPRLLDASMTLTAFSMIKLSHLRIKRQL